MIVVNRSWHSKNVLSRKIKRREFSPFFQTAFRGSKPRMLLPFSLCPVLKPCYLSGTFTLVHLFLGVVMMSQAFINVLLIIQGFQGEETLFHYNLKIGEKPKSNSPLLRIRLSKYSKVSF